MRTEAIKNFLKGMTHSDLAEMYSPDMEVQVNVAQDGGQLVKAEFKGRNWQGWTDGIETWKAFRIPWNPNTKPEYEDSELRFDLTKHAEGVGMTGWDWKNQVSRWVAFDFDSIVGHSKAHNKVLTDSELQSIKECISKIPWATIRKSTGGNGLHIYVMLAKPEPTKTHTEHAALGRAILGLLAAETGRDLQSQVDACGQNMWVWHRKMKGTNGLTLEKKGIPLVEIPANWRDHMDVITGHRKRVMPDFFKGSVDAESLFEELCGQRSRTPLDEDHKKLMEYLRGLQYNSYFDADNNMLVTHTHALMQAHRELSLKGVYETVSEGTDPSVHNCFAYPLRNGAWVVRRYTTGVAEAKTWSQDRRGWTRCFFNREPELEDAASKFGGVEHPSGGFVFQEAEVAIQAAQILGATVELPAYMCNRGAKIKELKDGRAVIEVDAVPGVDKQQDVEGWLLEGKKWKKVLNIKRNEQVGEIEIGNYDDIVRHLVDIEYSDAGWVIKTDGTWRDEPIGNVSLFLKGLGLSKEEVQTVLSASVVKCWRLINAPFESEYPGDRQWNRRGPQFRFPPSQDIDNLAYPTWQNLLNHIGKSLDPYILANNWARSGGLKTGADYLKCWISACFKHPTEPLPYLFLYGDQETGKSTLHEALSLLITKGVVRADQALSNSSFNGELEGAIICVVEETDFSAKNKAVYNLMKDWVTARQIPINRKYETPYVAENTTHWIQCSNEITSVAVFPGDSRVTMIRVDPLPADSHVPKRILLEKLKKEAPDFLAEVLNLDIPECDSRLFIPALHTADKKDMENSNKTALQRFIGDSVFEHPGQYITFKDFYDVFLAGVDENEKGEWSTNRVARDLNMFKWPKGRLMGRTDKVIAIGNISWTKPQLEEMSSDPYISDVAGNLVILKG